MIGRPLTLTASGGSTGQDDGPGGRIRDEDSAWVNDLSGSGAESSTVFGVLAAEERKDHRQTVKNQKSKKNGRMGERNRKVEIEGGKRERERERGW